MVIHGAAGEDVITGHEHGLVGALQQQNLGAVVGITEQGEGGSGAWLHGVIILETGLQLRP
ncbi:hypothetical protein HML84_05555 [Alcanivorax sp. IO_7]|nr:hypothetical protein HML84_05555 [Alcanivorax sp. IO_7]